MAIFNLTPHKITVYGESQFVGLEQVNPTTWIADSVEGQPLAEFQSEGSLRIQTETVEDAAIQGIPTVRTRFGDLIGVPSAVGTGDTLIVSLVALSAARCVSASFS
ncbi:MAG: hypothetical protein HC910_22850 [Spirulinaceae cyanobacterium SM2_1_0]|nr:hypothetical protein [Spirulinaceae cyanobacterium SM2_1_0]